MNHPQPDQWIPFLFGEANSDTQRRLADHLRHCPECAAQVTAWQRSLQRLDAWKLPETRSPRTRFQPALKWAVAAAVALVVFGLGRFSVAQGERMEVWRSELKSLVSTELRAEMNQYAMASSKRLALLEAHLDEAIARDSQTVLAQFIEALSAVRAEDRQATLALFEKLQEQRNVDFVLLRKDLETLAQVTDDQMQQARLKLVQLAASRNPNSN